MSSYIWLSIACLFLVASLHLRFRRISREEKERESLESRVSKIEEKLNIDGRKECETK